MAKTYLFVDGTNLYAAQYELFGPDKYLDFSIFIGEIEAKLKIGFDKIYFYASFSPQPKKLTKKGKLYLKNEALFYRTVKSMNKVSFFKGYRSASSGKEKEVDVKLTADLIHLAHMNYYNEVFLITGDADFLQALFVVHSIKKKIYIICLENKIMYKGIYRFPTYIIRLTNVVPKYRKTALVSELVLKKDRICKKIA